MNNNDDIEKEISELLDDDKEPIPDVEIVELMEEHNIDKETAEKAQELIGEGLDEDDAIEIAEEM